MRIDPNGSGDFGGLTSKFTPATLTPQGEAAAESMRRVQAAPRGPAYTETRPHDPGEPYIVVSAPVRGRTVSAAVRSASIPTQAPFISSSARTRSSSRPSAAAFRHIYMDGRQHPDVSRWTPTGSGHSVGHVENGELVVDTMGISPGGVTAGGWRTPETPPHRTFRRVARRRAPDDQVPLGRPEDLPEAARVPGTSWIACRRGATRSRNGAMRAIRSNSNPWYRRRSRAHGGHAHSPRIHQGRRRRTAPRR